MEGYLDLSKEIPPLLEALIFRQIEAKLNMETASLYPVVDKSESMYYITRESLDQLKRSQAPWLYKAKESKMSVADKVALLNKLNKETNSE